MSDNRLRPSKPAPAGIQSTPTALLDVSGADPAVLETTPALSPDDDGHSLFFPQMYVLFEIWPDFGDE